MPVRPRSMKFVLTPKAECGKCYYGSMFKMPWCHCFVLEANPGRYCKHFREGGPGPHDQVLLFGTYYKETMCDGSTTGTDRREVQA